LHKNFKFYKCFPSREDAESELIRQNHENRLDIKNTIIDKGDHYSVKSPGNKEFLADKCDLPFIEAHIWSPTNKNYVVTNQNGKKIRFHNLILGYTPNMNCSIDHINRNPLDNRRPNLRLVNQQIQNINRNPRNLAIQSGVYLSKNRWIANWVDEFGNTKAVTFNINKYGFEPAKQLAVAKRSEMELRLNHYRIALHGLPPLRPDDEHDELEKVPDNEQNEM